MPYTINTAKATILDGLGNPHKIDVFSGEVEQAQQEALAAVEAAKTSAISAVDAASNRATRLNNDTTATLDETANMIAEDFVETKAYKAGAYVRKEVTSGSTTVVKLYRLTADYTANTGWNNASKVEVKIGSQITDLKSAFELLDYQVNANENLEWTIGRLYGVNGYTNTARWMYSNIVASGSYSVVVPDGYRYQIYKYVSDTQGTLVANSMTTDGTYSIDTPFVVSVGNTSNTNLTNNDLVAIQKYFLVGNDDQSLVKAVERNSTEIARIDENDMSLAFSDSVAVVSGDDLDDYKTIGVYYIANVTVANNVVHVPVAAPGRLIVQNTSDAGSGVQIYISNFGDMFVRQFNASNVQNWKAVAYEKDYLSIIADKHISIPSGDDLNDYLSPGTYKRSSSSVVVSNLPANEPGELIVLTTATNNNIIQYYIGTTGNIYTRKHDAGGWSGWNKVVYKNDLTSYMALGSGDYTIIPSGADLNDYKTVGNYKIVNSTAANNVSNLPYKLPGELIVATSATINNIVQIYIDTNVRIYTRSFDVRGWENWETLTIGSEHKSLVDATNSLMAYAQALMTGSDYNISFANAPVPLSLTNYIGNTQNVHPKVLYFQNQFGGHYYWMAYTPYPYMKDKYENPCIAYSDDGYSWTNIPGNPLDDPDGDGYNSDTHLVYRNDTGVLECWYRYVTSDRVEEIYRQTTSDGITWSAKEKVLTSQKAGASHYLSPAVTFDGTQYKIWVVDNGRIVYYTAPASSPGNWTEIRRLSLSFVDNGNTTNPWHLDVIEDAGQYILLVMCQYGTTLSSSSKWSLFITTSTDNETYSNPTKVIEGSPYGWDKMMYRSSIVKIGNLYRIYYSGVDYDRSYHLAISESESLSGFIGKYLGVK